VEVRAVDVCDSNWEARLEEGETGAPAVRLGLNLVSGLKQEAGWRIEEARAVHRFADLRDLAVRAALTREDLQVLAAANALVTLAGNRRQALWESVAGAPDRGLLRPAAIVEDKLALPPPSEADDIVHDYRSIGLTLGRHPLALLREALTRKRFLPAEVLHGFANNQLARGCGIVTMRQRPGTAKGVMFVTIEDETGLINVIVWPSLVEQQRKEVLDSSLLGVYGIWQNERGVRHLVAKRLVDLSWMLGRLSTSSRDFA
jgi:error-prone DNA polymerase